MSEKFEELSLHFWIWFCFVSKIIKNSDPCFRFCFVEEIKVLRYSVGILLYDEVDMVDHFCHMFLNPCP